MNSFPNLETARLALLGESCVIANAVGLDYAVCGGWSPFLRNSSPIRHPGTKDVDLLFSDGVDIKGIYEVFEAFRKKDFLPSSKHEFQLIRIYSVGPGQRLMAFNVDLLHPTEGKVRADMFVDHCELPILEDPRAITMFMEKSMALPYSKFVFTGFVDRQLVDCPRLDGTSAKIEIPLIDEVGVLVTKAESCRSSKRPRDLLDIFLAISQPNDRDIFSNRLRRLKQYHPAAFNLIGEIQAVCNKPEHLTEHFHKVFEAAKVELPSAIQQIIQFLEEWGLLNTAPVPPKTTL
jgi:hypothetical protein